MHSVIFMPHLYASVSVSGPLLYKQSNKTAYHFEYMNFCPSDTRVTECTSTYLIGTDISRLGVQTARAANSHPCP